jgi:tetratricopeptide (TPR) repeat protein
MSLEDSVTQVFGSYPAPERIAPGAMGGASENASVPLRPLTPPVYRPPTAEMLSPGRLRWSASSPCKCRDPRGVRIMPMKTAVIVLFAVTASAQGWGRREAMRPWLQGRFEDAAQMFARMRSALPNVPQQLIWEAEFDIERGTFSTAAALLKQARDSETFDSAGLAERRLARLSFSIGRFADAQRIALEGRRWDGKNTDVLKRYSAMALVTLGEVALARGEPAIAASILGLARDKAKNASSIDGLEWARSQIDLALAQHALGSPQVALQTATAALVGSEREWGPSSLPVADALDAIGTIQIALSDFSSAESSLARSRARREVIYGSEHPKVAQSYLHLAHLRAAQHEMAEALTLTRRAVQIETAAGSGPNGRLALTLLDGAELLGGAGDVQEAKNWYESAVPVLEKELGPDSPRLSEARKRNSAIPRP